MVGALTERLEKILAAGGRAALCCLRGMSVPQSRWRGAGRAGKALVAGPAVGCGGRKGSLHLQTQRCGHVHGVAYALEQVRPILYAANRTPTTMPLTHMPLFQPLLVTCRC